MLRFAENQTVCQYLLSKGREISNPKQLALQKDLTRTNSTLFTLKPDALFKMCIEFGVNTSYSSLSNRCIVDKPSTEINHITCEIFGRNGIFRDEKHYCNVEWMHSRQEFRIQLNESGTNYPTAVNYSKTAMFKNSINGKLVCKIKDKDYSLKTFTYEAPFLIENGHGFPEIQVRVSEEVPSFNVSNTILLITVLLVVILVVGIGTLKYRSKP